MTFGYTNVNGVCGETVLSSQSYSVNFFFSAEASLTAIPKSGTPGYLRNKELLIGILGSKIVDTATKKII